jgi:hypothetical protein
MQSVIQTFILHFLTQASRYWQLIYASRTSFIVSLAAGPLTVLLLRIVVNNHEALIPDQSATAFPSALKVVFILTCINILLGLLFSSQEIVKSQVKYQDERLYGLNPIAYIASKLTIKSAIAIAQSGLIAVLMLAIFKSPDADLLPWPINLLITTTLTIIAALSLGFLISAASKNSEQASNFMLLTTIAQIVLSGVLFKVEGTSKVLSWFSISRWSVAAYAIPLNLQAQESPSLGVPSIIQETAQASSPISLEAYSTSWDNLWLNWSMLAIYTVIYFGVACVLQSNISRDRL